MDILLSPITFDVVSVETWLKHARGSGQHSTLPGVFLEVCIKL